MTIERGLSIGWGEVELLKYLELVKSGVKRFTGTKKYLATGSLETGKILGFDEVTYENKPSRANMEAREGDILFAKMKDTEKVFFISKDDTGSLYSTGFAILRVKDPTRVLPKYVFYWLRSTTFQNEKNKNCTGATQKAIGETKLRRFKIALPPIETQRVIVGSLEKAEKLIGLREEAEYLNKVFLRNIFLEMFGSPKKNPKKWPIVSIGDCIENSQYGTSMKSNERGLGYPLIGMGNITFDGALNLTKYTHVNISKKEFEKLKLRTGDVIFNRTNSPELVGKTAYWDNAIEAVLASYLVKLKLKENVSPIFFTYLMNTNYFKNLFSIKCKKAINQANISPTLLKEFQMYLPPIPLQTNFAEIVKRSEKISEFQEKSRQYMKDLFAIRHQALGGALKC